MGALGAFHGRDDVLHGPIHRVLGEVLVGSACDRLQGELKCLLHLVDELVYAGLLGLRKLDIVLPGHRRPDVPLLRDDGSRGGDGLPDPQGGETGLRGMGDVENRPAPIVDPLAVHPELPQDVDEPGPEAALEGRQDPLPAAGLQATEAEVELFGLGPVRLPHDPGIVAGRGMDDLPAVGPEELFGRGESDDDQIRDFEVVQEPGQGGLLVGAEPLRGSDRLDIPDDQRRLPLLGNHVEYAWRTPQPDNNHVVRVLPFWAIGGPLGPRKGRHPAKATRGGPVADEVFEEDPVRMDDVDVVAPGHQLTF